MRTIILTALGLLMSAMANVAVAQDATLPKLGETTAEYQARIKGDTVGAATAKQAYDNRTQERLKAEQPEPTFSSYSYRWYSYSYSYSPPRDECAGHPIPRLCRLAR